MAVTTNIKFCFVFTCVIIMSVFVNQLSAGNFSIDYDKNTFQLDGKPFRYISGSIHYSRVPHYYWKDRLLKMYAAGLNAIQIYVPWNVHEPEKGVYDFNGQQDLVGFIRTAHDVGLKVILRSGPYICGEWEFGGFPAWILKENPHTVFRTMDPTYIKYVDKWLDTLFPIVKPMLYVNGGPVIMVQIENEYGSYFACDRNYTAYLRDKAIEHLGKDVVLFTTDGGADSFLKCGKVPGVYATVDFGISYNPAASFKPERDYEKKGPAVNSEFYTGWLDHWGSKHSVVSTLKIAASLELLLKFGANINMYMFHGGTNFGYWNGANYPPYQPVPTSYDYDAPLNEAGDTDSAKYLTIRHVISKFQPLPPMVIPASTPKAHYGQVSMTFVTTLQDALKELSPSGAVKSQYPLTMEAIGQFKGFALYRHILQNSVSSASLKVSVKDRGYVMVKQVPQGIVIRGKTNLVNITGSKGDILDILVENQGHIGFGSGINNDSKGVIENVTLAGQILQNWQIYPILPDNFDPTIYKQKFPRSEPQFGAGLWTPSIYVGKLNIDNTPNDTYLDMTGWTKGQALLHGQINLGRYWPVAGPQVRLFVPAPYLEQTPNTTTLIMFELESAPCHQSASSCFVNFVDHPLINGTTHEVNDFSRTQEIGYNYNWNDFH